MIEYFYTEEGELDTYLFHEGTFYKSYEFLGAHLLEDKETVRFVTWAPRAKEVYLIGDFNNWDNHSLPLKRIKDSGLWSISVKGVKELQCYKYRIISKSNEERIKADPYAFYSEVKPKTASKYYDIRSYNWNDEKWMESRDTNYNKPMSIYEVNLSSWRRKGNGELYSYRELANHLIRYVKSMRFTHIELMPIMEHPYDGSWGYQITGYFSPTSRFGTPKDFMYLIDKCHQNEIGVILDWVPVHFCKDDHGLARFDGTTCYEYDDPMKAENDPWGTLNFDYSKPEVVSFLISSALYWLDYYHIDGLRVDAVAYMLYHDFAGKDIKNIHGGRENLEAIEFIKNFNRVVREKYPDTIIIAEESTSWEKVSHPVKNGGLGFHYKWNMGWMNDILEYMETDSYFRKGNQKALTFSIMYAFSENFILPLSHDEVVHGKKSLLDKMPGEYDHKFANLRLLYLYMYAHPGKKLLFMGGEFGQFIEWNEWQMLDWFLLEYERHSQMKQFVKELNEVYREETSLFELDNSYHGFEWIEHTNHDESIISFERIDKNGNKIIIVLNFTPIERKNYPIGVDKEGRYKTILNSDCRRFGGSLKRIQSYKTYKESFHDRDYNIKVTIPALGGIYLKFDK
ncbi:MAG TPA: 1,4-alpha-glucan branching protein GlgB [Tissierellaceae bacterium]|nr:1,4-alpha-glucan branching protein GlgB [Tissierellaceae bacterium]